MLGHADDDAGVVVGPAADGSRHETTTANSSSAQVDSNRKRRCVCGGIVLYQQHRYGIQY